VVKDAGKIYLESVSESELADVLEDPTYFRKEEPPDEGALLDRFRTWVKNTPGNFEDVLSEWIEGRLEMSLPVNPGPLDPNERPKKKPTKTFKSALEAVFNEVRASEAKRPKRKK
jgi:hypothetical protein